MAYTRAQLEGAIVARTKKFLEAVGMSIVVNGTNPDLNDILVTALLESGYAVANISLVADADVTNITTANLLRVLALAELRTLDTIQNQVTTSSLRLGPMAKTFTDLSKRIESLTETIKKKYAINAGLVSVRMLNPNLPYVTYVDRTLWP